MYIEDLITALVINFRVSINPFDSNLVYSFHEQIAKGSGFTEKQATVAVKILKRHVTKLKTLGFTDISQYLENPTYKLPIRTIMSHKRMSIIPHDVYGRVIKMEFPFNEALLARIRNEKMSLNYANWNPEEKSWIFSLDERSLSFLIKVATEENFQVDEEFKNYQNQIKEIESNFEQYVPMLSYDSKNLKFSNISPKIPQPTNSNILENLFEARKLGIFTWDETIQETDEWKNADSVTRQFLQVAPDEEFSINLENTTIFSLKEIVQYMSPVLFIIPGGTEIEKLEMCHEFLKTLNINNEEISVLFRLPKDTGEKFNNFVKEQKLNSPISEKTKAVFISNKVPKPIIESSIHFNAIVSFNFFNIHYSIRNLLKWHSNVIQMTEKKQQKELNFVLM
jgi:hypothetical protein